MGHKSERKTLALIKNFHFHFSTRFFKFAFTNSIDTARNKGARLNCSPPAKLAVCTIELNPIQLSLPPSNQDLAARQATHQASRTELSIASSSGTKRLPNKPLVVWRERERESRGRRKWKQAERFAVWLPLETFQEASERANENPLGFFSSGLLRQVSRSSGESSSAAAAAVAATWLEEINRQHQEHTFALLCYAAQLVLFWLLFNCLFACSTLSLSLKSIAQFAQTLSAAVCRSQSPFPAQLWWEKSVFV